MFFFMFLFLINFKTTRLFLIMALKHSFRRNIRTNEELVYLLAIRNISETTKFPDHF